MTDRKIAVTLADHKDSTPEAWRSMLACFVVLLAAAWFGFGYSAYARLMLVVCIVYCLMYFGTPWIMIRMRHKALQKQGAKPSDSGGKSGFQTFTGWTGNNEALLQMIIIPAALALAMIGIATVNVLTRPA